MNTPSKRAGRPRRHQADEASADTREHLLEVTETLLAERGYGGTSLGNVAGAAGVVKGTVTYHFPTKDALVLAVARRALERERRDTRQVIAQYERPRDQLAAVIRWTLAGPRRAQHARYLRLRDAAGLLPEAAQRELYETFIVSGDDPLRLVLEDGIRRGEFVPHDTGLSGRALLGVLAELASEEPSSNLEHTAAEAVRLVLHGLTPRSP